MEKRIDLNASDLSQQHFWNTTRTPFGQPLLPSRVIDRLGHRTCG
ncbi:MAG: hypothetical protein U1F76_23675 [Candidatus Competibacteraceae bacterium]